MLWVALGLWYNCARSVLTGGMSATIALRDAITLRETASLHETCDTGEQSLWPCVWPVCSTVD